MKTAKLNAKISLVYRNADITETSPFLVAKINIKYEKHAISALNNIKYKWLVDTAIKVSLIGINIIPPNIVAVKAYIEIVKDGISSSMVLVIRSLNPKKKYPYKC